MFPEFDFIDVGMIRDFHATDIRKLMNAGKDYTHMVHPNVYQKLLNSV